MKNNTTITHVYCMPGMCAKPSIFEHIHLPKNQFETHWLSWIPPQKNEPITQYSKRICTAVKHDNVILIGVSLGGIIIQEMKKFISVKKLILISTIKNKQELPPYMRLARKTGFYKLLPTRLAKHYKILHQLPIGKRLKKRLQLYEHYIGIYDHRYLSWAINQLLHWDNTAPIKGGIHIHGDRDEIFPIQHIKNCYVVKEGTHIIIINRFRWFNDHLPYLLTSGSIP